MTEETDPTNDRDQFLNLLADANHIVHVSPDTNESYEKLHALEKWMAEFDGKHPSSSGLSLVTGEQRTQREREIAKEVVQDENILTSIDDLLDRMAIRYRSILDKKNIQSIKIDAVILPPTPGKEIQISGSGVGLKPRQYMERRDLLLQILAAAGLDDDLIEYEGSVAPNMFRKESYHVINIPIVHKQILVCDLVGEATFVIDGIREINFYIAGMNKEKLSAEPDVHRIIYRDEAQWTDEILSHLGKKDEREPIEKQYLDAPMDSAYFSNSMCVLLDLQRFALATKTEDASQLVSHRMVSVRVVCSNGIAIHGATYLGHAAVAFGLASNNREAQSKRFASLQELKRIAGYRLVEYPELDTEYFHNSLNVRSDLIKFAQSANVPSPLELSQNKMVSIQAQCCNSQTLTGNTYLSRAGTALGLADKKSQAQNIHQKILRHLLSIAGYQPPTFAPRDRAYYSNNVPIAAIRVTHS